MQNQYSIPLTALVKVWYQLPVFVLNLASKDSSFFSCCFWIFFGLMSRRS